MATLLEMAGPGDANAQAGVMIMLLFRITNMLMGLIGGIFYATGKMNWSGIEYVSQGLTRVIQPVTRVFAAARRTSTRLFRKAPGAPGGEEGERVMPPITTSRFSDFGNEPGWVYDDGAAPPEAEETR